MITKVYTKQRRIWENKGCKVSAKKTKQWWSKIPSPQPRRDSGAQGCAVLSLAESLLQRFPLMVSVKTRIRVTDILPSQNHFLRRRTYMRGLETASLGDTKNAQHWFFSKLPAAAAVLLSTANVWCVANLVLFFEGEVEVEPWAWFYRELSVLLYAGCTQLLTSSDLCPSL